MHEPNPAGTRRGGGTPRAEEWSRMSKRKPGGEKRVKAGRPVAMTREKDAGTAFPPASFFSFQIAPGYPKFAFQISALHAISTFSRIASSGNPRRMSSLRSSKISSMASLKFSFASSIVSPCPFAPGISGHIAQYPPSGAGSIIAVNSAFISSSCFRWSNDRIQRRRNRRPMEWVVTN